MSKQYHSSRQISVIPTNKRPRTPERANNSQVNRRMNVNLNAASNRKQKKNITRTYKPDPIEGTDLDAVMENVNNNRITDREINYSNVGVEEEEDLENHEEEQCDPIEMCIQDGEDMLATLKLLVE